MKLTALLITTIIALAGCAELQEKLETGQDSLNETIETYEEAKQKYEEAKEQWENAQENYDEYKDKYDEYKGEYEHYKEQYENWQNNTQEQPDNQANNTQEQTNHNQTQETNQTEQTNQTQQSNTTATVKIHAIDVGQGDAIIIELPNERFIIYDCGLPADNAAENEVIQYLKNDLNYQGNTLWAVIASHGHLDHIGGCQEIVEEYQINHIYETWYTGEDRPKSYQIFQDDIRQAIREGSKLHTLESQTEFPNMMTIKPDQPIALPHDTPDTITIKILAPSGNQTTSWSKIAENSIILQVSNGQVNACFQGDIEIKQEKELIAEYPELTCELHLAGHHGSKYANSMEWLQHIQPQHAIYSYGTNSYGHPTNEALCNHQTAGAKNYHTFLEGNLEFTLENTIQPHNYSKQTNCQ